MQRTLREKRVGSGVVLLLTAHQSPFQNAGKTTTPADNAKSDEALQTDCSGRSCRAAGRRRRPHGGRQAGHGFLAPAHAPSSRQCTSLLL